jgi:hypothetical protein
VTSARGVVDRQTAHPGVVQQRDKGQLGCGGRDLVRGQGQPQGGHQRQQRAVGQCAGVIRRPRLTAKRQRHGLCCGLTREPVRGVPRRGQGAEQQGHEWHACRQLGGQW